MATEAAHRQNAAARSRVLWRIAAVLLGAIIVALVLGGWWASRQGYVSWFGTACTDEGYNPTPSYEDLISEHNKSPYCARLVRDETWF